MKRQPLYVNWTPEQGVDALKEAIKQGVADYETRYEQYFEENKVEGDELRDAAPRVILIPGIGMVTTGKDITNADVSRQLYHRAISVIGASEAIGGFNSLTAKEAYDIEYWPLTYKLKLAPPDAFPGKCADHGLSGIGRAAARRMAQDGATWWLRTSTAKAAKRWRLTCKSASAKDARCSRAWT